MAVTSVERIWIGEASSASLNGEKRFTAQYRALTDSADDDAYVVKNSPMIPREGTTFFIDGTLFFAESVECERERDTRLKYLVTIDWSNAPNAETLANNKNQNTVDRDPLEVEAFIDWTASEYAEKVSIDVDGNPIGNTAGDEFDPAMERSATLWTAHVEKNVAAVPPWLMGYQGAINQDAFTIDGVPVPPEAARLTGLRISRKKYRKNVAYRTLMYDLQIREKQEDIGNIYDGVTRDIVTPKPWQELRRNNGYYELTKVNGVTRRLQMTDDAGYPVVQVADLNIEGGKVPAGLSSGTIFLAWNIRKKKDFGVIPKA